jgi:hypothetical protein
MYKATGINHRKGFAIPKATPILPIARHPTDVVDDRLSPSYKSVIQGAFPHIRAPHNGYNIIH